LAPAQAELAERMAAALGALQAMFVALLDVSRIDAGSLSPQWALVPLAPLLRRLADEQAGAAEARGLRLSLHLADEAATSITDPLLLERVLRNLLANAVQHTAAGGVLLACRRRGVADGAGAARWRIEVWDSGCGIAPADQERVFQEFQQLGDTRGGLGLGLPIARRLVQLLQLKLTLHSRPGRGSVFFVDGLAPAGAAPLRAAAARAGLRRLAGATVAVLDDNEDVRRATRGLLQRWECTVHDAADADALLAQAAGRPQALVADLRLAGGRNGIAEAQRLFAAWGGTVPLLLVSGDSRAAVPAGIDAAILAKPASPARLRAWLEQVLAAPDGGGA
jgi:CheY-like chemotaxis protein/anti-sigma regulatory factor (Ser/Thr protein kinase)